MTDAKPSVALAAEVDRLEKELRDAKERLHDARIIESEISLGAVVIKKHDGKRYLVCEIDTYWSPPWLIGHPEKRDGTWSTARRNLFGDWERISP